MKGLSPLQEKVLDFIIVYEQTHGDYPTYTEIQKAIKAKHLNTVRGTLDALECKRYISRVPFIHRSIKVLRYP